MDRPHRFALAERRRRHAHLPKRLACATSYRRRHCRCPNAASSIARANAREGVHWPPCAMNRADASTTGCLLSSAGVAKTGATTDSTRANCCLSNAPGSRRPSASNVSVENVVRTTRTGSLATSSTITSAMRARCPAKADKQWLAGSRSIRWNLVLGSCQSVSSGAMRNLRQENPISAPKLQLGHNVPPTGTAPSPHRKPGA